jgi:hypothetical protein
MLLEAEPGAEQDKNPRKFWISADKEIFVRINF